MIIKYPYKFRLEPTPEQEARLRHYAYTCRFIYNLALDQRNLAKNPAPLPTLLEMWQKREEEKKAGVKKKREEVDHEKEAKKEIHHKITYKLQSPQMTRLRSQVDWMRDVPFSCLQETLRTLNNAFQNFFRRIKQSQKTQSKRNPFGYPAYRKRIRMSIPFKPADISIKCVCERAGGEKGLYFSELKVPLFGENIKFRQDRPIEGITKTPTIKLESDGHWYVVILTEQERPDPEMRDEAIGIDVGVAQFITLSDGNIYPETDKHKKTFSHVRELEEKIRKLQASCDRRKAKFSKNWIKAKRKIAKLKNRQAMCRLAVHHELSNQLTEKYGLIAVEDLDIQKMTEAASGTMENPGKNVKQKAELNRLILERGWGNFFSQLEYKSVWKGGKLYKVHPEYTSQTCPKCGHVDPANRDRADPKRLFKCTSCSHEENADVIGAKNILKRAVE